eukprot:gene2314-4506_t
MLNLKPGLNSCLNALQPGNTLVVWKFDRLGRSLRHLVNIAEQLRERGVGFKILTGQGMDTTTSQGKLLFGMFTTLAEFSENLLLREQKPILPLLVHVEVWEVLLAKWILSL